MKRHIINRIDAREILDCRGEPTVQVFLEVDQTIQVTADVAAGRSTGASEARELRDEGRRYDGRGVTRAVSNVVRKIAPAIVGMDVTCQRQIDARMLELDGTANKSRLGANAIVGVSVGAASGAAAALGVPLYRYIDPNA